ncbi:hypothetical protein F5146DRAFT_996158 [Armillaria mellea]|nr:hypothetical protein F5146DRAFT_996158 [Armillaria mellea]
MLSSKPSGRSIDVDPFILYSRSLRDYTLHLWTESRRVVEEEAQRAEMLREAEGQSAKACKGVSTHSQSSPLFSPSSTTSMTLKDKEKNHHHYVEHLCRRFHGAWNLIVVRHGLWTCWMIVWTFTFFRERSCTGTISCEKATTSSPGWSQPKVIRVGYEKWDDHTASSRVAKIPRAGGSIWTNFHYLTRWK